MIKLKWLASSALATVLVFTGSNISAMSHSKDIVDTAMSAGSFNTLVAALKEAGLVDTLKGEGPFTVFAPSDDAFAKIPSDQLNALLADKEKLTAVLTYHVVPGKVMASEVVTMDSAKTVQGQAVTIRAETGKVMINEATVKTADIAKSPGILQGPKTDVEVLERLSSDLDAGRQFHGQAINYRKDGSEFMLNGKLFPS
jgi:hypothetical protein